MIGLIIAIWYCALGGIFVNKASLGISLECEARDRQGQALFLINKMLTWPIWVFRK